MPRNKSSLIWIATISLCAILALLAVNAWKVEHQAKGEGKRQFSLDIDFDRFRQILVRTDATASIVENGVSKSVCNPKCCSLPFA